MTNVASERANVVAVRLFHQSFIPEQAQKKTWPNVDDAPRNVDDMWMWAAQETNGPLVPAWPDWPGGKCHVQAFSYMSGDDEGTVSSFCAVHFVQWTGGDDDGEGMVGVVVNFIVGWFCVAAAAGVTPDCGTFRVGGLFAYVKGGSEHWWILFFFDLMGVLTRRMWSLENVGTHLKEKEKVGIIYQKK